MASKYSVLMSVYHKEKPEYLKQAIESIQAQALLTDDFVLVCDGPLNDALDGVIFAKQQEMGTVLNVVRLAKNGGLGNALNEGIKYCKNELIARMDSDDIAYPDRCEKQLSVFDEHPEVGICSGIVEEFTTDPNTVDAKRVPPETNVEIVEFAKKRNPFNHPCVMYRKSVVKAVGSYQDFYLLEDYYLWLRMLMAGYQGYNIQEPLLHMRAGSEMYKRRAGWKYAETQMRLFRFMNQMDTDGMNVTARSYAMQIANFSYCVGAALAQANAIMTGWRIGAKKYEECDRGTRKAVIYGLVTATCFSVTFAMTGRFIVHIFTDDTQMIELVVKLLIVDIFLEFGRVTNLVYGQALKTSGDAIFPVIIGAIFMYLFAVGGTYFLGIHMGLLAVGAYIAMAGDECARAIGMVLRWKSGKWKSKSLIEL